MSKLHGFGSAITKDQWIQRTVNQSPRGHWVEYATPPMQTWEFVAWAICVGFFFGLRAVGFFFGFFMRSSPKVTVHSNGSR